jgi:hypothetical protein
MLARIPRTGPDVISRRAMGRAAAYRILCAIWGGLLLVAGLGFVVGFFGALLPGGEVPGPLSPIGPNGVYFMAFAGCALVGWGGALLGIARTPEADSGVGAWTAFALVLMALYRMLAWLMGDYARLGDVLRLEAALFLVVALAFVWLRPRRASAGA